MHYTYLAINFFTVLVPFLCSFEQRINFVSKWKFFMPACFISGLAFCIWDYYATLTGVWSFNEKYIVGYKIFGLPVEEIMFFFTVPYSCMFIYLNMDALGRRYKNLPNLKLPYIVLSVLFLVASLFFMEKAYTFTVLLFAGLSLILLGSLFNGSKLVYFGAAYIISLLPMFIVNGILTALPVVIYNDMETWGYRIGTIPAEDFIYSLALLALNVSLFELFKQRTALQANRL